MCVSSHILTFHVDSAARRHDTSSHSLALQPRSTAKESSAGQGLSATTSLALDLRLRQARTQRHTRLDLTSLCPHLRSAPLLPTLPSKPTPQAATTTSAYRKRDARVLASHPEHLSSIQSCNACIHLVAHCTPHQTSPSRRHHLCQPSPVSGFLPLRG
jgi:hypothetical protein